MSAKAWQSYEEVARHLLEQFAEHFELGHVERKQLVAGNSGTEWEIDAKGVSEGGEAFLIIECRRYTKSRLNQESMAALAFRIQDTGAKGGIVVSPLELQSGAKKVAASGQYPACHYSSSEHNLRLHADVSESSFYRCQ